MKGRKPEPSALKLLRGLPGKRKLSDDEPQPAPLVDLTPPAFLEPEAQAEWRRLAPILERNRVLTEMDLDALLFYCTEFVKWRTASAQIAKFGMVIKGKGDLPMITPYSRIADKAMTQMRALLTEFGMTPSSRARVHVPTKTEQPAVSKWVGLK